ncbi:MAG: ComF family protein [Methylocystaceae bacterium]|nr:ComF family protein [Methylocystaceae bacterium]
MTLINLPTLSRTLGQRFGRALLDLVYPPSCLACRRGLSAMGALCSPCWSRVRFIERPFCERLGTPFSHDLGNGILSPEAISDPPVYHRARAVAYYEDGPIADLVHRLKYADHTELAGPMGRWMARAGHELLSQADALIPIPLHRQRLFLRRFNQAALLAHAIARYYNIRVETDALIRRKKTPPQVGLTRAQRAANMQAAFEVKDSSKIYGKRLILIDDVLTSGATAEAAARALLRAGAQTVDVLVFASVVTQS